ncbi:hypothetical protein PHLGIDRAFT_443899, partial [Phlebiopsis gigantea 11061_1 CR5-6]
MSLTSTHSDMSAHSAQSLPSFAQTFGTPNLSRAPDTNNSLPPIHHRASSPDHSSQSTPQPSREDPSKYASRKRLHSEAVAAEKGTPPSSDRRSPRPPVRIKQEYDGDSVPPLYVASSAQHRPREDDSAASASPNPSKKRRMTIAGINTDVRRPSVDNGISPVVMGFTIRDNDPKALEQVRSMISLKQQQQALIEQRRGSTAGIVVPVAPPEVNIVNPLTASEEHPHLSTKAGPARGGRRSPVPPTFSGPRRSIVASSSAAPAQAMPSSSRHPSPPPVSASTSGHHHSHSQAQLSSQHPPPRPSTDSPPTHTHLHPSASSSSATHALPAPPISFARRRASRQLGGKAKPADLLINPRTTNESLLAPVIQSAPPVSRSGSAQAGPNRFPSMTLPSIPPVMAPGQAAKRYSNGQVPPTPTRLGMPRTAMAAVHPGVPGRSPPTASIPISTALVPPTPASLHHPGYTGEKSAFLTPFEAFYDALSDSKHLKAWLGEQLQKSSGLITSLQRQQAQLEDTVAGLVDKKMAAMREEVYGLRVRVDELEGALRSARAAGFSPKTAHAKHKGKPNGYQGAPSPVVAPVASESYTFPPQRASSPGSEDPSMPNSTAGSPVPFDASRRLSVSAARLDPR